MVLSVLSTAPMVVGHQHLKDRNIGIWEARFVLPGVLSSTSCMLWSSCDIVTDSLVQVRWSFNIVGNVHGRDNGRDTALAPPLLSRSLGNGSIGGIDGGKECFLPDD